MEMTEDEKKHVLEKPVSDTTQAVDPAKGNQINELIATMQASKSEVPYNEGTYIYEISYFIRPANSKTINFEVFLKRGSIHGDNIESTSANYVNPGMGFKAFEDTLIWTHIVMKYDFTGEDGEVLESFEYEVPIV